jgi:hypothetical protein
MTARRSTTHITGANRPAFRVQGQGEPKGHGKWFVLLPCWAPWLPPSHRPLALPLFVFLIELWHQVVPLDEVCHASHLANGVRTVGLGVAVRLDAVCLHT